MPPRDENYAESAAAAITKKDLKYIRWLPFILESLAHIPKIKGKTGEKGDKGDRGTDGERGPRGYQGEMGANGARGPKGDRGERGLQGEPGVYGLPGESVATAVSGPMVPELVLPSQDGQDSRLLTTDGKYPVWGMKITVSAQPPKNPKENDIWLPIGRAI